MTEKDKHELDVLRLQLQQLHTIALQHNHERIMLRTYAAEQQRQIDRFTHVLSLLGLLPADLDAPGALTSNPTLLLRLLRPSN